MSTPKKTILTLLIYLMPVVITLYARGFLGSTDNMWIFECILLFQLSLGIGVVGVLTGIGGGILFVPLVSSFFSFHIDFIRGTGMIISFCSALLASPELLRKKLAYFPIALPSALIASISAIAGAITGLYISAIHPVLIQGMLGILILCIALFMTYSSFVPKIGNASRSMKETKTQDPARHPKKHADKNAAAPQRECPPIDGGIQRMLFLSGTYHDAGENNQISWSGHASVLGILLFSFSGFFAGMFGIGAGWVNVPVLNLVMGIPLKVSIATSGLIISITGSTASWIYVLKGAVLLLITAPSVLGIVIGARIGAKLLPQLRSHSLRYMVILMLIFAGTSALVKALTYWN